MSIITQTRLLRSSISNNHSSLRELRTNICFPGLGVEGKSTKRKSRSVDVSDGENVIWPRE